LACSGFDDWEIAGMLPVSSKESQMDRPELGSRDRMRVEFRLPRAVAEAAYQCARRWDVSLSEAGARLIVSGLAQLDPGAEAKE
jgi:hypothetical protein